MTTLTSCDQVASQLAAGLLPQRPGGYLCVERYQSDLANPDRATAQTIAVLASQIREAIATTIVEMTADRAVRQWRGGPLYARRQLDVNDERMLACSVWFLAKHTIKFVEHSRQIKALLNERDQLQLLIRPDLLLKQPKPAGDCAIFTQCICALLGALNVQYEIITIACDPREPELFSHVCPRAITRDGHAITLDASHGKYPGWEVPRQHQIRRQVWNAQGEPVEDMWPPVAHLGQYWHRPAIHRVWPRRLGMGQFTGPAYTPSDVLDNSFGDFPVIDTNSLDPSIAGQGIGVSTPNYPGNASPAGSSATPFNWQAAVTNAVNQGIQLAGKVVAPTTTLIRGPGGQLFYQTPASSGGGGSTLTPLLGSTGGGGNLLLIGGAVVIGIIALSALSKR